MKPNLFIINNGQVIELDYIPGPDLGATPQGTINISYQKLVEILGQPNGEADGEVDAKWVVYTPRGIVVIQNWRDGKNFMGEKGLPIEKINHWKIKAHSENPIGWLSETLGVPVKKIGERVGFLRAIHNILH
ncbi:MAG: hypothetical protein JW953_17635 [Anaerolineae bacterium]|nr:hypothetical protein [Anaerolineae bacterium]